MILHQEPRSQRASEGEPTTSTSNSAVVIITKILEHFPKKLRKTYTCRLRMHNFRGTTLILTLLSERLAWSTPQRNCYKGWASAACRRRRDLAKILWQNLQHRTHGSSNNNDDDDKNPHASNLDNSLILQLTARLCALQTKKEYMDESEHICRNFGGGDKA